jgi:hypothetical protein
VSAIFIFVAAIIPVYLSFKLKQTLRKLTIGLATFVIIHGIYHVFGTLGYDFLADNVFEPLSAAVLVFFGISYFSILRNKKKKEVRST